MLTLINHIKKEKTLKQTADTVELSCLHLLTPLFYGSVCVFLSVTVSFAHYNEDVASTLSTSILQDLLIHERCTTTS